MSKAWASVPAAVGCASSVLAGVVAWTLLIRDLIKPRWLRWRLRQEDCALAAVEDDLERTHVLFGPKVQMRSTKNADGSRLIELTCRSCQQWNRVTRGFTGAVCGKCKTPLTTLDDTNEQRAVN